MRTIRLPRELTALRPKIALTRPRTVSSATGSAATSYDVVVRVDDLDMAESTEVAAFGRASLDSPADLDELVSAAALFCAAPALYKAALRIAKLHAQGHLGCTFPEQWSGVEATLAALRSAAKAVRMYHKELKIPKPV